MALQNTVTKIYRLETVGYSDIHKQFQQLSQDLLAIKKLIVELQGKSVGLKGDDLAKVNAQIREALTLNEQLEQQVENLNGATDKSVSKYFELNKAYKQAKENAQDLAAEFGIESEQAKEAAASAAALKQQLVDINNLVKAGGVKPQAPVVPLAPVEQGPVTSAQPQNVEVITNPEDLEKQKELLKETGDEVLQVKTKYEQYTGSLRDNIVAQIDNSSQLARNRDAQKAIQAVITAQGSATQQQIDQLAALKQQEQILIETNKQLTVTIRNQTQEFIAGVGAVDEMQAQLNQLQQQYEKLTEEQRASPFGQQLKTEIDQLLPKVKELEEENGKFGRNVGNYQGSAKIIVDALKNVENEISNLQQKQQGLVDFSKRNPVGFKLGGGQENLNQVTSELNGLQKQATALNQVTANPQFLNIAAKVGDNRAEVRFFSNQLSELRENGLATSDVFKQVEARLAELTKDTRETRESIKALSSETRSFDLFASSVNFLSSSFETFAGAESLFGKTTEEAQKKTQQLVAVIALANGTREIARQITEKGTAANKIYNFVLQNTKNVLDANATSATRWTSALKLGIAGVAVGAIVLLIQNLDKLDDKQKRLEENFNSLSNTNQLTIDKLKEYGDTIDKVSEGSIKSLDDQIKSLNTELGKQPNILAESTAAIQLNKNEIERLTASLDKFQTVGNRSIRESLGNVIPFIGGGTADKLKEAQKNLDELEKKQAQFNALQAESSIKQHENADLESFNRAAELQIDTNTRVLNNVKSTEQQKTQAVNNSFLQRRAIINNNLQIELNNNEKNFLKQTQAREKANAELIKNERDKNDQLRNLREQFSKEDLDNSLKQVDTVRDKQLADEQRKRLQNIQDEETYLKNILKINQDAIDKKIAILKRGATDETKLSADTQKQIAQLNLEKVKEEVDTQQKLLDIKDKAFQEQRALEIEAFENQKAQVELSRDQQLTNPNLSETERINIKIATDQKLLDLQLQLNAKTDELQKQFGIKSIRNARDNAQALLKIQEQLLKDQQAIATANLIDIDNSGESLKSQIDANYNILRQKILENDKLTARQRKEGLDKLEKLYQHDLLANELARLTIRFKEIQKQYAKGLADEKAFLQAKADMEKAKADLDNSNTTLQATNIALPSGQESQNALKDRLSKAFGFGEGSAEDQLLGNVIANSFSVAQDAMNTYFDAEQARIQQSLAITQQRIELEKTQAQARAQTQAEIDSIEKQAQAKTRQAQREAGEQVKKVRKSEARIALATELANIAVSAASNPLNGVTFGAAGGIMYALLAALAFARYAINVRAIESQQFAYGGQPGKMNKTSQRALSFISPKWYTEKYAHPGRNDVPKLGGKFGGQPHAKGGTDFDFKGKTYNAEVDELAIIRTRNAPKNKRFTITGTQSQIASAINKVGGGHDFEPGAQVEEKKNSFTNTVKRMFGFGGRLREQKESTPHTSRTEQRLHDHYAITTDRVMKENKDLVETKDISQIVDNVLNKVVIQNSNSRDIITKIVSEKLNQSINSISKTAEEKTSATTSHVANNISNHENIFSKTIKRIFSIGGILTEQNNKVANEISTINKTSSDDTQHVSTIIDRVMTENKNLVETKNTNAIVAAVITHASLDKKSISSENIQSITKIVNDKINDHHSKRYAVTGTTKQIYQSLDMAAKQQFAFGGLPGEVPVRGGEFGGRPHSEGGTKFIFKGKQYEAEVGELAIIKRRYADANKTFTVTGNQMQLASFANRIGGGIDFKPGARAVKYASGGFLGSSLQAPIFTPSNSSNTGNEALLAEIKTMNEKLDQHAASNLAMAEATNNRIDNIKTFVVEREITDKQNKAKKQTSIGTIS
jgi:hypothetical protein